MMPVPGCPACEGCSAEHMFAGALFRCASADPLHPGPHMTLEGRFVHLWDTGDLGFHIHDTHACATPALAYGAMVAVFAQARR